MLEEKLADTLTTYLLILPPIVGLLSGVFETRWLSNVKLDGHVGTSELGNPLCSESGQQTPLQLQDMKRISGYISNGASTFLLQELKYMSVYIIAFSAVIGPFVGWATMISFIVGSLTSIICGYIGMKVATYANVRCTHEAWKDLGSGFNVALRGGSVMGFCLVSLGVLNLVALIFVYKMQVFFGNDTQELYESIAGYGLGGSSIALFARVGGGIFTKAADVGADLSGKNNYNISEDDPRNPACIADNVGDNVGDVAGMGADLFGSLAESTCAALVIAGASSEAYKGVIGLAESYSGLLFPVTLSSCGIFVGIITLLCIRFGYTIRDSSDVEKALKGVLYISTALETPLVILLCYYFLPAKFYLVGVGITTWWRAAIAILMGLWSGLLIGLVTEYYTSHSHNPVQEISRTQLVSAATGIIYGLALGYLSVIIPISCLALTVCVAHQITGMYGVALSALGMLGTLTMGLAIDAYGPISDNAGGIAEMACLGSDVRQRTDALDAAGNTTAAIGKGFAIGSAALVSLALFGAYCVRAKIITVDVLDPWTFTGLLYGAMMPYAFSAMTMKSVGKAATDMVEECLRQFPDIMNNKMDPQYDYCIAISTKASLREMILPGALVILSPLVAGMLFGKNCTAGLLIGGLSSGVQLAISASNSGGAWDNAKKYIEAGHLGPQNGKGSAAHKNAVTGDTVGDPLKDTSGPSLNILVKLSAIVSLVFGTVLANYFSNPAGGPLWAATP